MGRGRKIGGTFPGFLGGPTAGAKITVGEVYRGMFGLLRTYTVLIRTYSDPIRSLYKPIPALYGPYKDL